MTALIEAMKLALDALEDIFGKNKVDVGAINALRTAIAEAEKQEPNYYGLTNDHLWMSVSKEQYGKLKPAFRMACYTTPPAAPVAALDRIKAALPEFRQQDDYLLAHGASLLSEQSHEIIHVDTALRIAGATPPAAQRKPLTDEWIHRTTVLMGFNPEWTTEIGIAHAIVRAVEAAHGIKEKNNG